MHPCRFPSGRATLAKKNDFEVKKQNNTYSFNLKNIQYKGIPDSDQTKCKITLRHKVSGELQEFLTTWVTFKPELEKLDRAERQNNLGVSKSELLREYGSAKDQRILKQNEKHKVNPEAQKAVRVAQRDVTKVEKIEALKGHKIDSSYVDIDDTMANMDLKKVQLSKIAPDEILSALVETAAELSSKSTKDLSEMVQSKALHNSVLQMLNRSGCFKDSKRVQLCLLLDHMIRFYNSSIKGKRDKNIGKCPPTVVEFMIDTYTIKVSSNVKKSEIQFPKSQKDHLFDMILCLSCYLGEYDFVLNDLQIDLATSTERLRIHLRQYKVKITKVPKTGGADTQDWVASTKTPFVIDS